MSIRDQVLGVIRRIVGTQMIVDILREQGRAGEWARHVTSSDLVAELQRRLVSRSASGPPSLDDELRGHLLSIIGARLGTSATHDTRLAAKHAFDSLIAGAHPDALAVAEVIALDFREELRDPGLPLDVACRYYDILYGLYWCGAQRFTDMARFDSKAVIPFAEWLRRHYPPLPASRPLPQPGQPLRVGYLCTYAHLERGNAIAPLVRSIVVEHARRPDRHVFMYCVQWSSPDFVAGFAETGVTVRDLPQGDTYASLDGIVDAIRADGIDVLITDVGSAVATYAFSRRAAPVQMWIDMGYPFWSIGELDWVLLPQKDYQGYFGIPSDRYSPLMFRQTPTELVRTVTQEEIDRARAIVPPGRFVIASFGRKIKASAEYLSLIRRLLRELPNAHFLLAGSGVSDDIDRLQSDGEVSAQVTVLPSMVDLSVFGHVIDVFCDTFPFSAGIVAREMQACGVPVVSIRLAEWDRVLREDRDAALLANGPEEYARLVVRLYADQDFREESRSRSLALASTYGQTRLLGDVLEDGIAKAIAYVNARKTQMPGT